MMDGEPNPIRDIVYRKLERLTERKIQEGFIRGDGPRIIDEIVSDCRDGVLGTPGDDEEKIGTMATVLLHYLCSSLLIPAQRKAVLDGVCIDMVIPDTKTLKTSWNSSVVLCILTSTERAYVEQRISDARRIQPNRENIWVVSPKPVGSECRTFVVGSEENPFSQIIARINEFLDRSRSVKFRIFKAV